MKEKTKKGDSPLEPALVTELLLMPDGQVLVHNLTPAFAELLHELNPACEQITDRTRPLTHHASRVTPHELPD
jgi:hypothetical protein